MASLTDEFGHNQSYKETPALTVRTERRGAAIVSELSSMNPETVIELGCGTGGLSRYLAAHLPGRVIATDISEEMLAIARIESSPANLEYRKVNLFDLNFYSHLQGKVDGFVGNGILHHLIYRLDELLPQFYRGLKPGGKLVFWEPNIFNPYVFLIFKVAAFRKLAKLDPDEMAFSPRFIEKKMSQCGFKVSVRFLDFLLPNTPTSLVGATVSVGKILEKTPLSLLAQSIFISATKLD